MAEGTTCTWPEWIAAWARAVGVQATYRQVSPDDMIQACGGDPDFGGEITDMFDYSSDPGYDGGKELLRAEDLRMVSVTLQPSIDFNLKSPRPGLTVLRQAWMSG